MFAVIVYTTLPPEGRSTVSAMLPLPLALNPLRSGASGHIGVARDISVRSEGIADRNAVRIARAGIGDRHCVSDSVP